MHLGKWSSHLNFVASEISPFPHLQERCDSYLLNSVESTNFTSDTNYKAHFATIYDWKMVLTGKGLVKVLGGRTRPPAFHTTLLTSLKPQTEQPQASTKPKVQINTRSDFSTGVSQILVSV